MAIIRDNTTPTNVLKVNADGSINTTAMVTFPTTQAVSVVGAVEVTNDIGNALPVTGSVSVTNLPATQAVSGSVAVNNFPATQAVSGSVTANAGTGTFNTTLASGVGTSAATPLFAIQSGATRSAKTFNLDTVAIAAATETLQTIQVSTDNAASTGTTSYTVTTGKRLRLQSLVASVSTTTGNTTAVATFVKLRAVATGAATVTSPLQLSVIVSGVTAANSGSTPVFVDFPDGYELPAGSAFGVTTLCPGFVATTAAPRVSLTIVGYEY